MEQHQNTAGFSHHSPAKAHVQDDAIDLGQVIVDLLKDWKLIVIITFIGCMLAFSLSQIIPKQYRLDAVVGMPDRANVEQFNSQSLVELDSTELFGTYVNQLNSSLQFNEYVTSNYFLALLFPGKEESIESKLSELNSRFSITPEIPDNKKRDLEYEPRFYKLSLTSSNEDVAAKLVNGFIGYTNEQLRADLEAQNQSIVKLRLADIDRKIALLRFDAKQQRERKIQLIEDDNALQIAELEQQKSLLMKLEKENRQTLIAEATEALKIAKELNIINPTPIDEFANSSKGAATSIKLSSAQSLPLYLMGTRYLNSFVDTLKTRKDDAVFIKRINDINKTIEEVKNDPTLARLKARKSDDIFIDELPALISERNDLATKDTSLSGINFYLASKAAIVSGKPIKPNKVVIVGVGGVLSLLFALVFVLMRQAVIRRSPEAANEQKTPM